MGENSTKVAPSPSRETQSTQRQTTSKRQSESKGLFGDLKNLSQDPQLQVARLLARKLETQDQAVEDLSKLGFNVLQYEEGVREKKAEEFKKKKLRNSAERQTFDDYFRMYVQLDDHIRELKKKRDLMPYDVKDRYWKESEIDDDGIPVPNPVDSSWCPWMNKLAAKVAKTDTFEYTTLGIISLNALYFSIDTSWNMPEEGVEPHVFFAIMEQFFCIYFTAELVIRFWAFRNKGDAISFPLHFIRIKGYPVFPYFGMKGDGWFVFDFVLVALMVVDTWLLKLIMFFIDPDGGAENPLAKLSILRLLRLARLTRLVKLMSNFPELLTLLKGMIASLRSVGSTLLLLVILLYVFAIAFTQLAHEEKNWVSEPASCTFVPNEDMVLVVECGEPETPLNDLFGNMLNSMLSLFLNGTLLDDITDVAANIKNSPGANSYLMLVFFLIYVLLSSFTVLNMLIGVLCEVVSATSAGETEKLMFQRVKDNMMEILKDIDEDDNQTISKEEFDTLKNSSEVAKVFDILEVDRKHIIALGDALFEEDVAVDDGDGDGELEGGTREKSLSFEEFLDLICGMRPDNQASVLDIAELRRSMRNSINTIMNQAKIRERHLNHKLDLLAQKLGVDLSQPPPRKTIAN